MKKCRTCLHWDTDWVLVPANEFSEKDFYANCTVRLGDDVFIEVRSGYSGCVVDQVETESNFGCTAWEVKYETTSD